MLNSTFLIFFLPCYSPSNRSFPLLSKVASEYSFTIQLVYVTIFFSLQTIAPFLQGQLTIYSQNTRSLLLAILNIYCLVQKTFLVNNLPGSFQTAPIWSHHCVCRTECFDYSSIIQWRPYAQFGDKMLKKVLACPWLSYHKMEKWKNLVFCKGVIQTLKCST